MTVVNNIELWVLCIHTYTSAFFVLSSTEIQSRGSLCALLFLCQGACCSSLHCAAIVVQTSSTQNCCASCFLAVRPACPLNSPACCRVTGRKSAAFQLIPYRKVLALTTFTNVISRAATFNFGKLASRTFTAIFYLHRHVSVSWQLITAIPTLNRQLIVTLILWL